MKQSVKKTINHYKTEMTVRNTLMQFCKYELSASYVSESVRGTRPGTCDSRQLLGSTRGRKGRETVLARDTREKPRSVRQTPNLEQGLRLRGAEDGGVFVCELGLQGSVGEEEVHSGFSDWVVTALARREGSPSPSGLGLEFGRAGKSKATPILRALSKFHSSQC